MVRNEPAEKVNVSVETEQLTPATTPAADVAPTVPEVTDTPKADETPATDETPKVDTPEAPKVEENKTPAKAETKSGKHEPIKVKLLINLAYKNKKYVKGDVEEFHAHDLKNFLPTWFKTI